MVTSQLSLFGPNPASALPTLFAEVVFDRPLDHAFSYGVPEEWKGDIAVGKRVLVPFGRGAGRQTIGFVVGLQAQGPDREVKNILRVLDDEPLLTDMILRLTRWMADYYLCGWGQVLNIVLPAGAKKQAGTTSVAVIEPLPEMLRPPIPEDLTPKQRAVLDILQQKNQPVELKRLSELAHCGPSVIQAVVKRGLARRRLTRIETPDIQEEESYEVEPPPSASNITLTPDQQRVWEVLDEGLSQGKYQPYLLHGVTGSGKTELYLRAIEKVVRQGKQAIILVPEISLTPQTVQAFRGRGWNVAVLHSHMHQAERGRHWRRIAAGQVQVVVGARSAIFAPVKHLGLIVIDEEHESSFKQDNTPRYHGRDVATMRARLEDIPIILGSATPSLESWHNAQRGQFQLLTLPRRVFDRPMPPVHRVDLRYDRHPDKKFHGISPTLERNMKLALGKGGQVILLLNRRGFSTFLHCPGCGHVELCKYCDLPMTFHRDSNAIVCHHCGYETQPPERCPDCHQGQVRYQGMGTEKLEGEIRWKFPGKVVQRMDSDTMKKPGSHKRVLESFAAGKIDILLGTQMIAKGLDFPNVTLVGVVNADVALHRSDFRAGERTFQLLAQVAGRTGRGPQGGSVYVQTFSPDHPSIALAALHDYPSFAEAELAQRQPHGYPPYQRMIRIVIRGKDQQAAGEYADKLAGAFKPALEVLQKNRPEKEAVRILGPAEAPIFRLKGLHRYHFQLQCPSSAFLHQLLRAVLPSVRPPHGVEVVVDVDPQDMM